MKITSVFFRALTISPGISMIQEKSLRNSQLPYYFLEQHLKAIHGLGLNLPAMVEF
jgi:hypothetical protein